MSSLETLKANYEACGQGHVFFYEKMLDDSQKKYLASQLAKINPLEVNDIVNKAKAWSPSQSGVEPLPATAQSSVIPPEASEKDVKDWYEIGIKEIAAGSVAVLLLAGGQGTRLGSVAPKGCYDIQLPSHKSLFQLQAERIAKLSIEIPWYIMTSGPTRAPTEKFFIKNNFFGLKKSNVIFFEQGTLPCLTPDGKIILESAIKVAVAPDGNGGVYKALYESGVIEDMRKRHIKHIHMYCVDNSLVKVADPVFIGFSTSRKLDVATKVVRKRSPDESVGIIASRGGKPSVIEYSEITTELREAQDPIHPGLLKLRAANIVNHYYSFEFLQKSPELAKKAMPFHIAHKKIPHADKDGKTVKPEKPNGIKLEQFVFDIFAEVPMEKFASLEVARSSEFSPVKNAPGSGEDCPETARNDLLEEGKRWLLAVGATNVNPVEISATVSFNGEGLEKYKGQSVEVEYIDSA